MKDAPNLQALVFLLYLCTTSGFLIVQPSRRFTSARGAEGSDISVASRSSYDQESAATQDCVSGDSIHEYPSATISDSTLIKTTTFQERYGLALPSWLLQRCKTLGFLHPTRIQQAALDALLLLDSTTSTIIQAETGSGKTLCYLLPVLASVDPSRTCLQGIIVVPTRELGLQVSRIARRLAAGYNSHETHQSSRSDRIYIMSVLQGSSNRRQRAWMWSEPPHLIVGTPQELYDMFRFGAIQRTSTIKHVTVDEVDACLLNNNHWQVSLAATPLQELLSKYLSPTFVERNDISDPSKRPLSTHRQSIFCSATIPQPRHFLKQCLQNQWTLQEPRLISCSKGTVLPPTLSHSYVVTRNHSSKLMALRRMIQKFLQSQKKWLRLLVFCEPKRPLEQMARAVAADLKECAVVGVLRWQDSSSQRAATMEAFSSSTTTMSILFSTDLEASRGLDVANISHIVHYDLPPSADAYVHRAGRSGRRGQSGKVMSIVTKQEEFVLNRLANELNLHYQLRCVSRQKEV